MDVTQFDESLRELLRRHDEDPTDIQLISKLCYEFNIRSYHNYCIDYARRGLARDPYHADLYYEMIIASSLDTAHILEDMVKELEGLLEAKPKSLGSLRNLALLRYFLEQDDEAELLLIQVLDACSDDRIDRRTFEILAQLEYTRQHMERCIEYCEKAIDRPGSSARMVRLKGLCFQEMGDNLRAKECFKAALELEPFFVWACHSLGTLCLEQKQYSEAFRYFGKAGFINPMDPGNLFLLAEAFLDMEAYELATAELEKLLLCKPETRIEAEVNNALGYIWMKREDWERAMHHLSLAIELEPELAVAYFNMGRLAQQQQVLPLAERHFKNALSLDPQYVSSWVELGFLYLQTKDYQEARECFESALDIDPDEAQAFLGFSKLSHKEGQAADQLTHALQAFELDPDDPEICNNLGIARECNHNPDEAEEAYLRALDLDPDHSPAANNLGYLYEKKMTHSPEKEDFYREKAIEAWKIRLRVCAARKKSTKGAVTHLVKLGVSKEDIEQATRGPEEVSISISGR